MPACWLATARSGRPSLLKSATAVATGPPAVLIRGPGASVQFVPVPWPKSTETSFEPVLATSRSALPSPLTSATVTPVGLVPAKNPWPPLSAARTGRCPARGR